MTQYQIELKEVIDNKGDVEAFKKDWHERACAVYRTKVKSNKDIHKFRSGDFKI